MGVGGPSAWSKAFRTSAAVSAASAGSGFERTRAVSASAATARDVSSIEDVSNGGIGFGDHPQPPSPERLPRMKSDAFSNIAARRSAFSSIAPASLIATRAVPKSGFALFSADWFPNQSGVHDPSAAWVRSR